MTAPYPINTLIPAASHYPGNDQPGMQTNFANINGFLGVDHVDPGTASIAGQHEQVTLPNQNVPGFLPTGNAGIIFTGPGAQAANSQLFFDNASASFMLNPIRAFVRFVASGSTITKYNVTSVTKSTNTYTINLTTNCVTGGYAMFVSIISPATNTFTYTATYSNTAPTVTINAPLGGGDAVSVMLLQA